MKKIFILFIIILLVLMYIPFTLSHIISFLLKKFICKINEAFEDTIAFLTDKL